MTKLSYYFMQWPFFQVNAGHPVPLRVPLFRLFLQISGLGFLFIIFIVSCRNAIHTVRTIVDKMIEDGNTVNMCAIDLSKAFDKVNHKGLFTKLLKRHIPTELLELLENWLSVSSTCTCFRGRVVNALGRHVQ